MTATQTSYAGYLTTLRRLPREVVLEIAGREIDPGDPETCICGWALRLGLSQERGVDADYLLTPWTDLYELVRLYGGDWGDWYAVYHGILDDRVLVEQAFMRRVLEVSA